MNNKLPVTPLLLSVTVLDLFVPFHKSSDVFSANVILIVCQKV